MRGGRTAAWPELVTRPGAVVYPAGSREPLSMRELGQRVARLGPGYGGAGGGVRWGQESPECPDTLPPPLGRGALGDWPACPVSGSVPPRQGGRAWRLGGSQEPRLLLRSGRDLRPAPRSHPQGDGA